MKKITPIIMSGCSGTRLWPLSRQNYPKQFLSLFNQKSLFQQTISRVSDSSIFNPAIITINHKKDLVITMPCDQLIKNDNLFNEINNENEIYKVKNFIEKPNKIKAEELKKIIVKPHSSLSLQIHKHRSEHWIVVNGVATVIKDDQSFILNADESTYIKSGTKHRIINDSDNVLEIIEVQTGKYLEEDDITRFDDLYGR